MASDLLTAPGRAQITVCPDCRGGGCEDCDETGKEIYRACPQCGDIAWAFVNRRTDADGMVCVMGCGHKWTAADPAWLIQHL